MNAELFERQPHVALDVMLRRGKAIKIERLLNLEQRVGILRLLEVGVGSGGIAHYFGTNPSGRFQVEAVDVVDNRQVFEGYRYTAVTDTCLPFVDASFDVVISNHVIEHVGDEKDQRNHLAELRRVLKRGGVGYLAVPNRWMLVEPHFHLAFLSWLPKSWRSGYLRLMGRGNYYDCQPLEMRQCERLLADTKLQFESLCVEAIRATFDIEYPNSITAHLLRRVPDIFIKLFRPIIPTLIYRFWH